MSQMCFLYLRCNDGTCWISEVKGKFCVLNIYSCKVQSSLRGVPQSSTLFPLLEGKSCFAQ